MILYARKLQTKLNNMADLCAKQYMSTRLSRVDLVTPSACCDTHQGMIGFEHMRSRMLPWQLTRSTPKSCAPVLNKSHF